MDAPMGTIACAPTQRDSRSEIPQMRDEIKAAQDIMITGRTMIATDVIAASIAIVDVSSNEFVTAATRSSQGPVIPAAFAKAPNDKSASIAATSTREATRPIEEPHRRSVKATLGDCVRIPTLSCGQASTQSKQNVQSKFPRLAG